MSRVVVGGVGIHYEVEGRGPPLVLQHGFTDSLASWYDYGYVDALATDHQLVIIDARGHGDSDKPHDPNQYPDSAMALDVVAVLDDLRIERSAFYGHSMGGSIGLALAQFAPERFTALGIGGSRPDPAESAVADGFMPLLEQGPAAMLGAWQALGELTSGLTQRILAIDCEAMIACLNGVRDRSRSDTEALAQLPGQYRFFMGDNDWFYPDMTAALDRLDPGSLVTYPGLNHLEFFQRSDLVVPDLRTFLDDDP